ncbi:MAG: site-specific integrase [Desulfobacterales bacterium]|nr:site-specific integrase [Desulfobacterales bacterium]
MGDCNNWLFPVIGDRPLKQIRPLDSEESPSKQIRIPKIDNRRLRFLTHSEVELLLEHLKKRSTQLYNMSLLSIHTGMRAGEIFALTWGHMDLEKKIIRIIDGKSGKNRVAYMTDDVKAMFENLIPGGHDDFVFTDTMGRKIVKISNIFERTIKDLRLNNGAKDKRMKVVFHALRHTFASWLAENGTDLYTLKELMGYSTLIMTERYSHLGENTPQAAVNGLQDRINFTRQSNIIRIRKSKRI